MKVRVGDKVKVIAGSSKGKEGKVIDTFKKDNKVVVEGVNIIKKHQKPRRANESGSIVEREAAIHVSNVKVIESVKNEKKVVKAKATTAKKTAVKKENKKSL